MKTVAVLLFCIPVLAQADALDELRGRLAAMRSDSPLKARVEIRTTGRRGEEGKEKTIERSGSAVVELGRQGLKLSWTPQQIAAAQQEAELRAKDEQAPAPNLDSLTLLKAREATALLDYAPPLALLLDGAQLLEQRDEAWQGQPARLLLIQPDFKFNDETRKLVKSHEGELRIWLDPAGLPLAMERRFKLTGSKFFISFTAEERETRQFVRAGGRLVVVQADTENSGSGFGETGSEKTRTTVTLETGRK